MTEPKRFNTLEELTEALIDTLDNRKSCPKCGDGLLVIRVDRIECWECGYMEFRVDVGRI